MSFTEKLVPYRRAGLGILGSLLGVASLFHVFGVTVWRGASHGSLFGWLYMMWSSESTDAVDYSHGTVIPLVSLWLLWRQRKGLLATLQNPQPHIFGVVLLVASFLLHAAGLRMQIPHASAMGFIVALWGLVWIFMGKAAAGLSFFPVCFLVFAIPVGFLAHATFPLRMLGSIVSTWVLNGIGIPTVQIQTAVVSTAGQGFALDVADACSGIRSMMALMALTGVYAYVFQQHWFARWFLFVMSVPIAAVANIGRIVTIAIVARFWGQDLGMKMYHDYSGYLVFVLCVLLVMGLSAVVDRFVLAKRSFMCLKKGRGTGKG